MLNVKTNKHADQVKVEVINNSQEISLVQNSEEQQIQSNSFLGSISSKEQITDC